MKFAVAARAAQLLLGLVLPLTSVFGGAIITFDEMGRGTWNGTPFTGTPIQGGGLEYDLPFKDAFGSGDFLIYDADRTTLSDVVQFSSGDSSILRFLSLDSDGLPADTQMVPPFGTLLGTTNEDASGGFHFVNLFSFEGSSGAAAPEPCSVGLFASGLAVLLLLKRHGRSTAKRPISRFPAKCAQNWWVRDSDSRSIGADS